MCSRGPETGLCLNSYAGDIGGVELKLACFEKWVKNHVCCWHQRDRYGPNYKEDNHERSELGCREMQRVQGV